MPQTQMQFLAGIVAFNTLPPGKADIQRRDAGTILPPTILCGRSKLIAIPSNQIHHGVLLKVVFLSDHLTLTMTSGVIIVGGGPVGIGLPTKPRPTDASDYLTILLGAMA